MTKKVNVPEMRGGQSLLDPSTIEDNQFELLRNFYYDESKRVRTRRGITTFGQPIPDEVTLINNCDAITNFAVSDDATGLYNGTLTGTVSKTAANSALTGAGTAFLTEVAVGQYIKVPGTLDEYKEVTSVLTDTDLTVAGTWSFTASGQTAAISKRGNGAVHFNIDVTNSVNDYATLENTSLGNIDISDSKGYYSFWMFAPTAFNTNLTDVRVRLGTDSSNYYEWTLGTQAEAENNLNILLFSDATETGTVNDTDIDYFRLQVTYTAAYTDKIGVAIDNMFCYSATSTKPVTSLFYSRRDDSFLDRLLAAAGTNMFLYSTDSGYWEVIDTNLREYELGDATKRTRWDFAVYKNIIYMCNGNNIYRSWNDYKIATHGANPNYRYIEYMQDRLFGVADENPSTLDYSDAAPLDGSTVNTNSVVIGGDEWGKINGMREMGNVMLCGKDKKIYYVDIANTTALPIDAQNGLFSQRAIAYIDNSLIYYNDLGIDALRQKVGVSSTSGLNTEPLTEDLQPLIDKIEPAQYNANCGAYYRPIRNYYFIFDASDDNVPESTIVRSSLTSAWSEYTLPSSYDIREYSDTNNDTHLLLATATGGQVFEIEQGFDDNGVAIEFALKTKAWDFDAPEIWKDFQEVYIAGRMSEGGEITATVLIDDEEAGVAIISDAFLNKTASAYPIGASPIGDVPIGGSGSAAAIELYPFEVKIPMFTGGKKIQIQMTANTRGMQCNPIDRMTLMYNENTVDLFPIANIA